MSEHTSNNLLGQVSELVAARMGLDFREERWPDFDRAIGAAAREFGFQDTATFCRRLISAPLTKRQLEILARHLTIGETYFFRDPKTFEILEEHILPELIRSRQGTKRRLRIWSAGCATGAEPYSVAILISQMIPNVNDWNITILATDINSEFLRAASQGIYREWSFRTTPASIKARYFERKSDGCYEILPQIRKMVTFSYLNLVEDRYPSLLNNTNAMDIIFCRNVLMYFARQQARRVVQKLYLSLVPGGWLISSPSEASQQLFSDFKKVVFPDAILYRKESESHQAAQDLSSDTLETDEFVVLQPAPDGVIQSESEDARPHTFYQQIPVSLEERPSRTRRPVSYAGAVALYEQGRYAEAVQELLELCSDRPSDLQAMTLLARAYANQGQLREALEWCERAIAVDRLDARLHYLHATILQEQGANDAAATALQRVLYLDPNFVLAYFALGNIALREAKFRVADKHFKNVRAILSVYQPDDLVPESEGMTAGQLMEIVQSRADAM